MVTKTYIGTPPHDVQIERDTGHRRDYTRPLTHHVLHSPTGFSWGYGGSGPAELARCILWDHTGNEPPTVLYQRFKSEVIARLPMHAAWRISGNQVDDWMAARTVRFRYRLDGQFDVFVLNGEGVTA